MKRLLLTRPEEDSIALRDALRRIRVESFITPMLEIENIPGPAISTENLQGFLVTSANGVRALAARTDKRELPMYAVGDATARAAMEMGFGAVTSASGDVDDLATLVKHACDPADGGFFHAAGTVTAGDLSGQLSEAGFQVIREKIYEAKPVDTLPYDAAIALKTRTIQGVVLYSPRTAETFVDRVNKAGLMMMLAHVQLIALSQNVRNAAGTTWSGIIVARQPTQESLLNAVRTCYY
jgi:uroporphyrinogen-III synthase